MKILVTGSRVYGNKAKIKTALVDVGATVVVHGGARGADTLAGEIAKELGLEVKVYPAQWAHYGKGAGPIRNQEMLDKEKPDLVLAFPVEGSIGTKDMIDRATRQGYKVEIF